MWFFSPGEADVQKQELAQRIKKGDAPLIIDVRSALEYRSGHIPGAQHCSLFKILFRLSRLPEDKQKPLVLTCEHGPRAQLAKAVICRSGYARVELLDGHMAGWRNARLPLEK